MGPEEQIEFWRKHMRPSRAWVIFENGTCVVLTQPQGDLADEARRLLSKEGPVHVATPSADFTVHRLQDTSASLVTYHHPDVLSFVAPDEVDANAPTHIVGLVGRSKRARDARDLKVIHVQPAES